MRTNSLLLTELCHNFSLGLVTKARGLQGCGPSRKFGNARKCEGRDPHTPKGTPTLGVGIPVDSQMFGEQLQGSKPNGLRSFFISLESY
jgi:hypothetical protein